MSLPGGPTAGRLLTLLLTVASAVVPLTTCELTVSRLKHTVTRPLVRELHAWVPGCAFCVLSASSTGLLNLPTVVECSIDAGVGFLTGPVHALTVSLRPSRDPSGYFRCPQLGCGHTTRTAGQIRVHMRKHTGEKPFACRFCDFRCSQSGNLTVSVAQPQRLFPRDGLLL